MYSAEKVKMASLKTGSGERTPTSKHTGGKNYSSTRVSMASLGADGSARNKIGSGSDNKNYSKTPPKMPMGKEVGGNVNRVDSHHGG